MSSANKTILTKEGYDKIIAELEDRKGRLRDEIANELEQATEQGDLSENAAYKSALEEKEMNENKIENLEGILSTATIVEADNDKSSVGLGNKVTILAMKTKKKLDITIVGHNEADPINGKISMDSPLGKVLIDKKKGEKVSVVLPTGEVEYTVEKIS
jgi:transcription elongation factor GreA